jgi:hypothetical protein
MFFSGLDIRAQRNPNFVCQERYPSTYGVAAPMDASMIDVRSFPNARSCRSASAPARCAPECASTAVSDRARRLFDRNVFLTDSSFG